VSISWKELINGEWTAEWTERPCQPALLVAGRIWPQWRTGKPPSWEEILSCDKLTLGDRKWLVVRVLVRDQKELVGWALDCAEHSLSLCENKDSEVAAVLAGLRAWCAGDHADVAFLRIRADAAVCRVSSRADATVTEYYVALAAEAAALAAARAITHTAVAAVTYVAIATDHTARAAHACARASQFHFALPRLQRVMAQQGSAP
jgi:hypothetical protein